MKFLQWTFVVAFTAAICTLSLASDNCYDHQTNTYDARFQPTDCTSTCTVTPFFSPDTSVTTYVNLIESATESIDIFAPGLRSWSHCTDYAEECEGCTGCTVEDQRKEAFPIFPALLNAVHERGVKIRIVTNNFTIPACAGKISPLDWLVLNGVQVRMYTTTTFMHAKFITVDKGRRTAVSSVNWSYTSFMDNRESGVVLENCTCSAINFYQSVFEYDFDNAAEYQLNQQYSPSDMKIITSTDTLPIVIPTQRYIEGAFVTKLIAHTGARILKAYTSPDNARSTMLSYLSTIKKSLQVAIYQVTDTGLCEELLDLHNKGVNVTLLVSDYIVSYYDYYAAQACYKKLYEGGMAGKVQYALSKFTFSHEKYWIIDDTEVHLSTGNWSPSDFPMGTSWPPYAQSQASINRDLEVALEHPDIVTYFQAVFSADWAGGKAWKPKTFVTNRNIV